MSRRVYFRTVNIRHPEPSKSAYRIERVERIADGRRFSIGLGLAERIATTGKPCPFCGGPASVQKWHGGGPDKRMIGCATETGCVVLPSVTGETPAEALRRWNRRAP